MSDRRAFLQGIASLPGIAVAAGTAMPAVAGPNDPLPALYAEMQRVTNLADAPGLSDEEADRLFDVWGRCDAQATATPAKTLEGAAASIEWVRRELLQFGFQRDNADNGTRLILALLDGALGVMLAQIGGRANG